MNHPGDQEVQRAREWAFDYDVHYHEAYYRGEVLTRECDVCGLDMTDPIHLRSDETREMARKRYAELYSSSRDAERLAKSKELAEVSVRSQEYLELRWAGMGLKQCEMWERDSLEAMRVEFNKALIARDAEQKSLVAELVEKSSRFAARVMERCPSWFAEEAGSTDFADANDALGEVLARAKETL